MQDEEWPLATAVVLETPVPHHKAMKLLGSVATATSFAQIFLGLRSAHVLRSTAPQPSPYSVSQTFHLAAESSKSSLLNPLGKLPTTLTVGVKAEMPSSLTMTFHLGAEQRVQVALHVHPSGFDQSTVTLSLKRNFCKWPGVDMACKYVLVGLARALPGRWLVIASSVVSQLCSAHCAPGLSRPPS